MDNKEKLLNGKKLANEIILSLQEKVENIKEGNIKPKLVVVIVGEDFASHIYVKHKVKACKKIGFLSEIIHLKENSTFEDVRNTLHKLNNDQLVHGILLQIPLPKHLLDQQEELLQEIIPNKDIDCFNFYNFGKVSKSYKPIIYPCTPLGIIKLIKKYNIDLVSKNIVIIGFSNIVGKPLALMLENEKATITVCNIYTKNKKQYTINADIIITATGKKDVITVDMVKKDVIIIDAGILRDENNKVRGDVDYKAFLPICSYITPVPRGVGPMTVAILMENLWKLYELNKIKK